MLLTQFAWCGYRVMCARDVKLLDGVGAHGCPVYMSKVLVAARSPQHSRKDSQFSFCVVLDVCAQAQKVARFD